MLDVVGYLHGKAWLTAGRRGSKPTTRVALTERYRMVHAHPGGMIAPSPRSFANGGNTSVMASATNRLAFIRSHQRDRNCTAAASTIVATNYSTELSQPQMRGSIPLPGFRTPAYLKPAAIVGRLEAPICRRACSRGNRCET
jgi:hypothetical protein